MYVFDYLISKHVKLDAISIPLLLRLGYNKYDQLIKTSLCLEEYIFNDYKVLSEIIKKNSEKFKK